VDIVPPAHASYHLSEMSPYSGVRCPTNERSSDSAASMRIAAARQARAPSEPNDYAGRDEWNGKCAYYGFMALEVRTVEYFYVRLANDRDDAYRLLAELAEEDINLLAFSAVPFGETHVEFTLFPERSAGLLRAGAKRGWELSAPQHAVLIQGDDHLGAVADIYKCLSEAGVAIYASSGVTDGGGRFGYVIYFRQDDYREAARAIAAAAMKI